MIILYNSHFSSISPYDTEGWKLRDWVYSNFDRKEYHRQITRKKITKSAIKISQNVYAQTGVLVFPQITNHEKMNNNHYSFFWMGGYPFEGEAKDYQVKKNKISFVSNCFYLVT